MNYLLAIDQGTTNSRAIIFDQKGVLYHQHELPLQQFFPQDGWVEQDPEELVKNTIECCQQVLKKSGLSPQQIAAIGITNQRETTIVWDKHTGQAIYPAIVWQDRRTSEECRKLSELAFAKTIQAKTGLLLDPYFSATKLAWILQNVPNARARAEKGELLFGTVDTFLLWKLTKGKKHLSDITNACRTLLFNIHTQKWDDALIEAFDIPKSMLPEVCDNTAMFGELDPSILGAPIPITGMAGDQQAATIGQACFKPGMVKVTYGTGSFMLLNTGKAVVTSKNRLLSTVAYRINNEITYGIEGSIFSAGVSVKWLRDQLHLFTHANETAGMAQAVPDNGGIYFVPAFTGLGAPYWAPEVRAALFGITSNTNSRHIVRAALESVAYQTRDLLEAMRSDLQVHSPAQKSILSLRVDGGMVANEWLLQFLADILGIPIERPMCIETTALGAVYLAGLQIGLYQSLDDIAQLWQCKTNYTPMLADAEREALYAAWLSAVSHLIADKP